MLIGDQIDGTSKYRVSTLVSPLPFTRNVDCSPGFPLHGDVLVTCYERDQSFPLGRRKSTNQTHQASWGRKPW